MTGVNAECEVGNAELTRELGFRIPNSAFRTGFVAANIPNANRTRPHPASQRGIPVALTSRATAYTTRGTPAPVRAPSAARTSGGTPPRTVGRQRAASRPTPEITPDGQSGPRPPPPAHRSR